MDMTIERAGQIAEAAMHFKRFLAALGHQPADDPHLEGTPLRVAKMYAELLGGKPFSFTTFPAEGADQLITVRSIPFVSFCAHHFLPFTGTAAVAYIPGEKIAGLSKLARTVQHLASQPQVQERLTEQIADMLEERLGPRGVGVMLAARHECMELRGARAVGAITITTAVRGIIRDDPKARSEFLEATRQ